MVPIKLGGEVRQLQFSHKAIKALQQHYGSEGFSKINVNDIEHLDAIIWACLLRHEKGLMLEDVEDMISDALDEGETTYDELSKAITKAIEESQVAKEFEAESKKKTVVQAKRKK